MTAQTMRAIGAMDPASNARGQTHVQQSGNRAERQTGVRTQARTQTTAVAARSDRRSDQRTVVQPNFRAAPSQHQNVRSGNIRRVRASAFRYPQGYSYRRWSSGSILPSLFLSSAYFYNSWATVGAYPPPRGYVWVRYGPDLLLVSRRSGRIRDVIYGVFY
jgi:Ni/Co efflux regulator RcnB